MTFRLCLCLHGTIKTPFQARKTFVTPVQGPDPCYSYQVYWAPENWRQKSRNDMEELFNNHEKLVQKANLAQSIKATQACIDKLSNSRNAIAASK